MFTEQPETIHCVVDNRVLVLGIDEIYRKYMKEFESVFLLPQVEFVAAKLNVGEANVPIEGYYGENQNLTRYFKLMRALQEESEAKSYLVDNLPEFQEIWKVTNSPIFGKPQNQGKLLPQGRDPLSQALIDTHLSEWKVDNLINAAYESVTKSDDISLVGLAVRIKDPIAITALRESVILYAEKVLGALHPIPKYEFIWKVDNEFTETANRFIDEFNNLLPKNTHLSNGIPKADPQNARRFYFSYKTNDILGRCANIGYDDSSPRQYYHWAITQQNGESTFDEFWDTTLWTTANYRSRQEQLGWKSLKDELRKG